MNPIEIHATLTVADWRAYVGALQLRLQRNQWPMWQRLLTWLVLAFGTAVALSVLRKYSGAIEWSSVTFGVVFAFVVIGLYSRRLQRLAIPEADGCVLGP